MQAGLLGDPKAVVVRTIVRRKREGIAKQLLPPLSHFGILASSLLYGPRPKSRVDYMSEDDVTIAASENEIVAAT
ncbi:MAG: hypothetical protein ACRD3J_29335, partial [Thermoanaerobaculia bacterium]